MQPFPMKYNTSQFIASRVVIRLPTGKNDDAGNATKEEVYSMEPKLNAKDFLKAESVKMRDMSETMEWYRSIGAHGSVDCVFIPPLSSIAKGQSVGSYWQKKFIGLTVYRRRATMSNLIYKLLMIDGVLPRNNDEPRDIVMVFDGDGYETLYNILQFVHPTLMDERVEEKIPSQGVSDSFASHIKIVGKQLKMRLYTAGFTLDMRSCSLYLVHCRPSLSLVCATSLN
jgi:hypothetical protein